MGKLEISVDHLHEIARKILESKGFPQEEATTIRECLMYAELRENNQGLQKLKDITYAPKGAIKITCKSEIACVINGNYNHAMVVLQKACEIGIQKAKKHGAGIVGLNHTNTSSGALGYYTSKIAKDHGLIAVLAATTIPIVAPYGGTEARIGTNPLSVAIPSKEDPVVFDATTAQWSYYAVVEAVLRKEQLPLGVAVDSSGEPTTDPGKALKGSLLPRGVLGWGFGVVIQLLSGQLVGAFSEEGDRDNWGHNLVVLDPSLFCDSERYLNQVSQFAEWVHTTQTQKGFDECCLPGERGTLRAKAHTSSGALLLDEGLYEDLKRMAEV